MWNEESFYSWRYDRPTSPWMFLGSILMLVVVFALCCFQLAPYKVKLGVVYGSASLLSKQHMIQRPLPCLNRVPTPRAAPLQVTAAAEPLSACLSC